MTDHPANDQFHASSFMQGHNAEYLEQMYARYANDPNAVDESWQAFFKAMGDDEVSVKQEAAGPSWARADWPPMPNDDLTAALTGEWAPEPEVKSAGNKIKAKASEQGVSLNNFTLRYEPSHPAADQNGYIKMPNVNPLIEMSNMREAARSYEANLSMLDKARDMRRQLVELLK